MLADIAISGTYSITQDAGLSLDNIQLSLLGTGKASINCG
jgi:hypothetical protein